MSRPQGNRSLKGTLQMLITGPNGSGKSAYGKQVAMITYMAQIGW